MAIRNKPTFDPYSLSEFSLTDVVRAGLKSWRTHRGAFLGLGLVASTPTLVALTLPVSWPSYLLAGLSITFLVAVIAPLVARFSRGLTADVAGALSMVGRRFGQVLLVGLMLSVVITGPFLVLNPYGVWFAYLGLTLGAVVAAPFVLMLPVAVIEDLPMKSLPARSLFLVRGRLVKVAPLLVVAVFAAVVPPALRMVNPGLAFAALALQPLVIAIAAIGIGSLYATLYQR